MKENNNFLSKQILTYIGNKRSLLFYIDRYINLVKKELGKNKIVALDLFSGSGVVSRLFKQHSSLILTNDLEDYSRVINECFLLNKEDIDENIFNKMLNEIIYLVKTKPIEGILCKYYSPKNDDDIRKGERVFYTHKNALFIDSFRHYLDLVCVNKKYKNVFLALLVIEASIHVNTCGVFKGFYKDNKTGIGMFGGSGKYALNRIKGDIEIKSPYLSNFSCEYRIYQEDATKLVTKLKDIDLAYLDPPYNQHPYGSNYFMLNLIINNKEPKNISRVSGIVKNWNRSSFNKKSEALKSLEEIIINLKAKYILISYNNEGFISFDEMVATLNKYGSIKCEEIKYNAFRGSHNLNKRNIHTKEFLFLLKKEEKK